MRIVVGPARSSVGRNLLTGDKLQAADVNGNQAVDIADLATMVNEGRQ